MSKERKRSSSPFPSAYKLLAAHDNDKKKTIIVPPTLELLRGCAELNGVHCKNCHTWDETGVDWHIVVFMQEDASPVYEWYCKVCFKPDEHVRSDYVYSGKQLENAVESTRKKK